MVCRVGVQQPWKLLAKLQDSKRCGCLCFMQRCSNSAPWVLGSAQPFRERLAEVFYGTQRAFIISGAKDLVPFRETTKIPSSWSFGAEAFKTAGYVFWESTAVSLKSFLFGTISLAVKNQEFLVTGGYLLNPGVSLACYHHKSTCYTLVQFICV